MIPVAVKVLDPRLSSWGSPSRGSALAAGLDLHACLDEPLVLQPRAPALLISAGFAMRIGDARWAALVLPRSGAGHKRGLVLGNGVGLVDADYQGPVLISAWNRNPDGEAIVIQPGDRIAQLVFVRTVRPRCEVVDEFAEPSERGAHGFGSSGV